MNPKLGREPLYSLREFSPSTAKVPIEDGLMLTWDLDLLFLWEIEVKSSSG
jgi:hypothetical protein